MDTWPSGGRAGVTDRGARQGEVQCRDPSAHSQAGVHTGSARGSRATLAADRTSVPPFCLTSVPPFCLSSVQGLRLPLAAWRRLNEAVLPRAKDARLPACLPLSRTKPAPAPSRAGYLPSRSCSGRAPASPAPAPSPAAAPWVPPLPGMSCLCNRPPAPASFPPPSRLFTFWLRGEFHSEEIAIVSQPSHGKVALGRDPAPGRGGAEGAREAGPCGSRLSQHTGSPFALPLYKGRKEFFFA